MRWDGQRDGAFVAICLSKTETLIIINLTKNDNKMLSAQLQCRLRAIDIAPVQATRHKPYDLLILKPDRTLSLLMHGLHELPLLIALDRSKYPLPEDVKPAGLGWSLGSSVTLQLNPRRPRTPDEEYHADFRVRVSLDLRCKDSVTNQCLSVLALMLPSDFFFELHAGFLHQWSRLGFSARNGDQFDSFVAALCELLGLQNPGSSPISQGSWDKLSTSSSFKRSLDDPVLKMLKLPNAQPARNFLPSASTPHTYIGPILCGLHHVAQENLISIRRHDQLWILVPLICKLASLVRPEWVDYWKRLCPDALDAWPQAYLARKYFIPSSMISIERINQLRTTHKTSFQCLHWIFGQCVRPDWKM